VLLSCVTIHCNATPADDGTLHAFVIARTSAHAIACHVCPLGATRTHTRTHTGACTVHCTAHARPFILQPTSSGRTATRVAGTAASCLAALPCACLYDCVCAAAWWSSACRAAEHAVARAESLFTDGPLGCAHFMWPASAPPFFCSVLVLFPLSRWLALSSRTLVTQRIVQCTHRAHQQLARVPCDRPTETVRIPLHVSLRFGWHCRKELAALGAAVTEDNAEVVAKSQVTSVTSWLSCNARSTYAHRDKLAGCACLEEGSIPTLV
jgi:hypothetical protein